MKVDKIDRRVKYTTSLLKESLVRLMQTKPISKISVKMLCEDADINRSTFYAHFDDQYGLLRSLENEVITNFKKYLSDNVMHEQPETTVLVIKQLLDYAAEDTDLLKVLLSDNSDMEFQKALMSIVQEQLISNLRNDKSFDERTFEYLQCFVITGALKILQKWIQDGTLESTQEIAELISNLLSKGISCYL